MAYRMSNRPRPTRESVTVSIDYIYESIPQHVDDAYQELYYLMEEDWYGLLALAHGGTLLVIDDYAILPSLIAFSMACERREAEEGEIAQLPLILRYDTGYGKTIDWLYEYENQEPGLRQAMYEILKSLGDFWYKIREQPQRHEPLTTTPFNMVWRLLERQKQMAEAGEGHMARIDRLLDLLLQGEFAGLFPMVLTTVQWTRIFLADFELEDCKMLYTLEMQYCFIELPVYRAA
ncbi:hypothetical protein E4U60_000511 [Claviceps pazoutovae]|uniref:Uncharacterized protein n=1 Tax=Claviceps pazoutovae TaxID=1649127 RepID=A0A9P7S9K3_9HYPO|nr:hypothetical protein E4U60_000511 [Claviceps pazoutovae]